MDSWNTIYPDNDNSNDKEYRINFIKTEPIDTEFYFVGITLLRESNTKIFYTFSYPIIYSVTCGIEKIQINDNYI